jgi:hypothetical protein
MKKKRLSKKALAWRRYKKNDLDRSLATEFGSKEGSLKYVPFRGWSESEMGCSRKTNK